MLVCPQCHFENPNTNKFCQKCGTSLTHKTCPDCGAKVALNAERCSSCGANIGTVWLALISREEEELITTAALVDDAGETNPFESSVLDYSPSVASETFPAPQSDPDQISQQPQSPIAAGTSESPTSETPNQIVTHSDPAPADFETDEPPTLVQISSASNAANGPQTFIQTNRFEFEDDDPDEITLLLAPEYLDTQQRYKLLQPLPPYQEAGTTTQVKVLDTQPFQQSLLGAIIGAQMATQATASETPRMTELAIPSMVQPYLALKSQFSENLPTIHDAWQHHGQTVLLLEDLSPLPLLSEWWGHDDIEFPQVLKWLYQLADLWAGMEAWSVRQSLLEEANLRVDQHYCLRLQYLYPEPEPPLPLSALGLLWQQLFQHSQRTQFGSVTQLLEDVAQGHLSSIEQLKERLDQIAQEIVSKEAATRSEGEMTELPTLGLPMQLVELQSVGRTNIGLQRDHNEDSFGIETNLKMLESPQGRSLKARCLYILCDGMGGHAGGEVASHMAVETLRHYFQTHWHEDQLPSAERLQEAVLQANQAIYEVNQQEVRSGSGRMGTTLVMVLLQDAQLAVAHVGDSRLYRYTRSLGLEQLTVDHEVGQREIKRGIDPKLAYERPDAYQLTQALGPRSGDFIRPDVQFYELQEDTLLLLASDGLTDNNLLELYHASHLQPLLQSTASLEKGIDQLIHLANEHNGHDNITAILIRAMLQPYCPEVANGQ